MVPWKLLRALLWVLRPRAHLRACLKQSALLSLGPLGCTLALTRLCSPQGVFLLVVSLVEERKRWLEVMIMEIMKMGLGVPWSVRSLDVAKMHTESCSYFGIHCVASLIK